MSKSLLVCAISFLLSFAASAAKEQNDYLSYHDKTTQAETLITEKSFEKALEVYKELFNEYDYVFLRDHQIATQLAWHLGKEDLAFNLLKTGIANGWEMKHIKKNKFLKSMRNHSRWIEVKDKYDSLYLVFEKRLDPAICAEIRSMSLRDQRKAFGALFRIGSKAQDRYGENKFAPLNDKHLARLIEMINEKGYPGERMVGFEHWAQGIVSRHNSISKEFSEKDTVYQFMRPMLLKELEKGQISPYAFALIEDWYISVKSGRTEKSYGYINELSPEDKAESNEMRSEIGLRPIEIRNILIDLQESTGMNYYLPEVFARSGKMATGD